MGDICADPLCGDRCSWYNRSGTPMQKLKVRTVILSDVHLGTADCRVAEVNHFLKNVRCEKLILNGDIIDGWQLTRSCSCLKLLLALRSG